MGRHSAARLPLRVVHIASGDLYAGAEVQLYQLARQFHRSKACVSVVLMNEGVLAERLRAEGIPVLVLDEGRLSALHIAWRLWRYFWTQRPDIVHTHRRKENILGAWAAALTPQTRSVRTVHGTGEAGRGRPSLLKMVIGKLDLLVGRFVQDAIITVSQDLRNRLQCHYPSHKLHFIPNGIDPVSLDDSSHSLVPPLQASDTPRVAFIGRLAAVKRPDLFVRICQEFLKLRLGSAEFYVIGDGPLRAQITNLIRATGVDKRLHLIGFVDNTSTWLRQMDVLLLPSDDEGTPMVLLEAMAVGVPVMAHAVGGVPDMLRKGRYGRLMESQDPEQWARSLVELLTSPERAEQVSLARQRVLEVYTAEACAEAHLELYAQLTASLADRTPSFVNRHNQI